MFRPARWPHRPVGVISELLSPLERAVSKTCLAGRIPIVWILAHGLPGPFPPPVQHAIDNGRLLVMTPFDATVGTSSAARAAWCNQYALHRAATAVIGQLTPDGILACLLADLPRDIPIHVLDSDQSDIIKAEPPAPT